jgi:hypothetical protein
VPTGIRNRSLVLALRLGRRVTQGFPRPGSCRRRSHRVRTAAPTMTAHVPTARELRRARPLVPALVIFSAVGLNGVATGAYIGAGLASGPRDGLMTGLASSGRAPRA